VAALLALGGGYYLGSYRYTEAPSVIGLSLTQATSTLDDDGLKVRRGDDEFSEEVPKGQVISQQPGPKGRVRKGGTVTVHLSKGPDRRAVPNVTGKSVPDARNALVDVGLEISSPNKNEFSDTIERGKVIRTDPKAGDRLKPGTTVTLVVSKGKEPVEVPNVTGQKQDKAVTALQDLGFKVDVQQVFSDTVAVGVVVEQTPSSGTADKGSTITLKVSKGPDIVTVPDVRGMNHTEAKGVLERAGLTVKEVVYLPGGPGDVLTTDPKPGKKVKRGTTVTVYYY
jgi:serine/threonine-protein kinase